jgi:hypothetical protein
MLMLPSYASAPPREVAEMKSERLNRARTRLQKAKGADGVEREGMSGWRDVRTRTVSGVEDRIGKF